MLRSLNNLKVQDDIQSNRDEATRAAKSQHKTKLDQTGPNWIKLEQTGSNWTKLDQTGPTKYGGDSSQARSLPAKLWENVK